MRYYFYPQGARVGVIPSEKTDEKTNDNKIADFPGSPVVENPPAHAGDTGSILSPGGFHRLQSN